MLRQRPFPSKNSGDENTTEHSPFSIFRSRALSSPIEPADIPNFRKKFVWLFHKAHKRGYYKYYWFAANPSWSRDNSA